MSKLKPDFICVGAQKAGTGWLWDQVRSHPQIWMPPIKEIRYFLDTAFDEVKKRVPGYQRRENLGPRGQEFLQKVLNANNHGMEEYMSLFSPAGEMMTGDISPGYFAIKREKIRMIADALPECRFLFLMRDPIDRLWSQVNMLVRASKASVSVLSNLDELKVLIEMPHVRNNAQQARAIRRWGGYTGSRFALFEMEELREDAVAYRQKVFAHLGLDGNMCQTPADFNRKINEPGKQPLPPAFREYLREYFASEYVALNELKKARRDAAKKEPGAPLRLGPTLAP